MSRTNLQALKFATLLLLLPGVAGLVIAAMISMHEGDTLPRSAAPAELRMTPRSIGGVTVYQTEEEDRRLSLIEYSSLGMSVLGLGLGSIYLEKKEDILAGMPEEDLNSQTNPG